MIGACSSRRATRRAHDDSVHGGATADGWTTLVLEDLSGAQWPPPYVDDGAALLAAVARVGETTPPGGVSRRPAGRPLGTYWERIAATPDPVFAHASFSAAWLERCLPELVAAESRARLDGDDFLHDDVWHGNVCYARRGALLIDWASASIGDRRLDLAYALLSIRACGASPPAVEFEDEAAYAALLAGVIDRRIRLPQRHGSSQRRKRRPSRRDRTASGSDKTSRH